MDKISFSVCDFFGYVGASAMPLSSDAFAIQGVDAFDLDLTAAQMLSVTVGSYVVGHVVALHPVFCWNADSHEDSSVHQPHCYSTMYQIYETTGVEGVHEDDECVVTYAPQTFGNKSTTATLLLSVIVPVTLHPDMEHEMAREPA